MAAPEYRTACLPVADYIRGYRDLPRITGYCRTCGNYGTVWGCPPHEADPLEDTDSNAYACIVGIRIPVDDAERHRPADAAEAVALAFDITERARKILDGSLLEAERRQPGSRAFFAGSCRICGPGKCRRRENGPCPFPDRMRPSLEACGFDIEKTARELLGIRLQWSEGAVLPACFTLVGGLFAAAPMQETWPW